MNRTLSTILFFFLTTQLMAIGFDDAIYPELATSGRALAMGNAFISKVDDSNAVFYNPAGLGTIRTPHIHLSNFHLEMNEGLMDVATGGPITDAVMNAPKGISLDGARELVKERPGILTHARIHALPNITARYVSAGFLFSKQLRSYSQTVEEGDKFEYADRLDYGPYASANLSLFGGVIKMGGTAVMLRRVEATGEVVKTAPLKLEDSDYAKGTAIMTTAGFKLTLPITYLPTFSFVLHNAAGQKFSKDSDTRPEKIGQSMDVGFSLTPQMGRSSRVHFEVNYKDLSSVYGNIAPMRKLLVGMELDFSRAMFVRGGYGDGYGSAGLGIKSRKLEFDLTTYAMDLSPTGFRVKKDRRFSMSISSGF